MRKSVDANKRLHSCKFASLTSLLDLAERKLGLFFAYSPSGWETLAWAAWA